MQTEHSFTRQILLVEDDTAYARAINTVLTKLGYVVEMASNGRSAANLIGLREFDLVLSDVQLPEYSGIQLLHSIKRIRPSLPVVLMTAFTSQTNDQEAKELGAAGFLAKPFTSQSLVSLFDSILVKELPQEGVCAELSDFCEISIDEFISGKTVDLDLYVRLGDGKFVKIAHAGEELPPNRLRSYRDHKLQYLYVAREDYEKYVTLQLKLSRAITVTDTVSKEKKIKLLKHANEVIYTHLNTAGVNPVSFNHAKSLTEANLAVLARNEMLFSLVETLNDVSDHLFAHALGVSIYSSMLARALGWTAPSTLYKISLGGLLHDIGLKDMPGEILSKSRRSYTAEQTKLYERHPLMGLELLKTIDGMPTEILLMVAHHHENRNGSGYPAGLREAAIYPLAKVITIADEFCELTIRSPGIAPRSVPDALNFMKTVKKPFLDVRMLDVFLKLFAQGEKKNEPKPNSNH